MTISNGIIIFFLALVTLVAEFILYFIFGISAAFADHGLTHMSGIAAFFVGLMVMTAATGVLAPIASIVGTVFRKPALATYTLLVPLGIIFLAMAAFVFVGSAKGPENAVAAASTPASPVSPSTVTAVSSTTPGQTDAEAAAEKNYLGKVTIQKVQVGKDVLEEKGVWGELKNTGNRTLSEVGIKLYYLGKDGQPVFEKPYSPVLVTDLPFAPTDNQPLKPGYSTKFGVKADDVPSEWAGKVKVEVEAVKFAAP